MSILHSESPADFISVAFSVCPSKLQLCLSETAIAIVQTVVKRGVVGGEIGAGGCYAGGRNRASNLRSRAPLLRNLLRLAEHSAGSNPTSDSERVFSLASQEFIVKCKISLEEEQWYNSCFSHLQETKFFSTST